LIAVTLIMAASVSAQVEVKPVEFEKETLPNGLRVIYAPLRQAPVVHVRVLYHVGSRDEKPDRQGFAHMFEHMMFRGSKHVEQEQHMRMINGVGGNCNAFTSFDQTTYINTLPAEHLEMALYLEADRMASFRVSEDIYKIERNVVAQEWRQRTADPPLGTLSQDLFKTVFSQHSYRWTPIGDMAHLRAASVGDLQEFWNTYYVPNNACLIITGDIDIAKTKEMVRKYFGYIPKGADIVRNIPAEPDQTEARRLVRAKPNVQLAVINIAWKTAEYRSDDHHALDVLSAILGRGRTSRLSMKLVNNPAPLAVQASASSSQLQDLGMFGVTAAVLPGKSPDEVEKALLAAVKEVADSGVTQEELDRIRTQARIRMIRSRDTATALATQLGEAEVFGGDANRVNEELKKLEALTPADIQKVAAKYLSPEKMTVVMYVPDPQGRQQRAEGKPDEDMASAPVAASASAVEPRKVDFPADYPTTPPMAMPKKGPELAKGEEMTINGVRVIVMPDNRLPLVNLSLVMRSGSHLEPAGKEGVAGFTLQLMRRGAAGMTYQQLNEDLESRGINIDANDGGDNTRVTASATVDQVDHMITRTRQIMREPTWPAQELARMKTQAQAALMQGLNSAGAVASRDMSSAMYGNSPLGRNSTPASLASITLEDIKKYYDTVFIPNDAVLIISGDVTAARAKEMAEKLLADWKPGEPQVADYTFPSPSGKRRIILVDNPDGKQATIRMSISGYNNRNDDRFAGSLASVILSSGIESRLGRYVRAEKGYSYGVSGVFGAGRQAGAFTGSTEVAPENCAPAIEAMWKVFNDMKTQPITETELADAKRRVAGQFSMETQTIAQQAGRRLDAILNGYPIDYYDKLPERLAQVTAEEIQQVMNKYVNENAMTIIVVGPAEQLKGQLEKLGDVEVRPMPLKRPEMSAPPTTQPNLVRPAA
jgi:zinc protease